VTASWFVVVSLPPADVFVLDGPEGHHAATVQRLRVGEDLVLCDGQGGTAAASVTAVGRGTLEVRVRDRTYTPEPSPRFVVVQGIAKGDRGELAVQAMTEVGVDAIVPWAAARSIARWKDDRPRQRWADTAREAAKQARRAWIPTVARAISTGAVASRLADAALALVLHESASAQLSTVELPVDGDIVLVIGPEGGIAPEELASFEAVGAQAVRMGPSVLRTSTAGPAALAVLSARVGRW
jgi:16S rRNA (uracil1498-N3)-methyltransferase